VAATEKTEFRVLYDEKSLYIGVWVWDSEPAGIMGRDETDAALNKGDQLKITIASQRASTSCGGITTSLAATSTLSTTRAGTSICR
jgi:hypothetical protein